MSIEYLREKLLSDVQEHVNMLGVGGLKGRISDGYHTFNELYYFRMLYNAALFNEWAAQKKYDVHKSKKHHDGEICFGGGWFIVSAKTPFGLISNHYELCDWDLFKIPETETALFEFDGHTSQDVADRIKKTILNVNSNL